jgi:hypothetical protein
MAKTKKRPLTSWNLFVKKVKNDNPGKTFKEVLMMASALKKKGNMTKNMSGNMPGKKMPKKKTGKKR